MHRGRIVLAGNIDLEHTPDHLHIAFGSPSRVLSSAVLNGGLAEAEHVLNLRVLKHPPQCDRGVEAPEATLQRYCGKHVVFGEALARVVIEATVSSVAWERNHSLEGEPLSPAGGAG